MNVLIFGSLMTFPSLLSSAPAGEKNTKESYNLCETQVCMERAKMINDSLNTSVDPCDDFYSYACGGWIDKHPIPESKPFIGNHELVLAELEMTLKNILGNTTLVKMNQNITDKLAVAYNACLEVPTKGDQIPVLRRLMNESGFCLWPRMYCRDEEASKIGNCTDVLANIPIRALFKMRVDRDLKELKSYIIELDQPTFPFVGRNELIYPNDTENKEIMAAYRKLVTTALKIMKEDAQEEELLHLANGLVDFEGQFANLTAPPEERGDHLELYHKINISVLQNDFPNVPLLDMLNQQFSRVNITLNESEAIEVLCMEYYENLNTFLETVDCDMLYDYAGLRMLLRWADSASEEFRNALLNLTNVDYTERWEKCVTEMNDKMPEITGYLYVQEKFSEEAKREVEDLVERIKAVFNESIRQIDWTHNKTKAATEAQLTKMILKVGYPEWLFNTTYLEQLYKYVPNLNISSSYLEMYYIIEQNNWLRQLPKVGKPYDSESTWIEGPATVQAYYNPYSNSLVFPAGILQGAFYQHGLPRSLNFGAIGMLLAHEMIHSYDYIAIELQEHLYWMYWWTDQIREKYYDEVRCIIYQYGAITDKETNMKLNPYNTVNENIADNGGLRMAYKAYERLLADECNGEDTRLPGLEHLSGKKLFFLANAMMLCDRMRNRTRMHAIANDRYSLSEYRVNIPMQNMPEFSSVFNCPSGSTMNATDRCQLW